MSSRSTQRVPLGGFGSGPIPRDLWILLGVLFATFSLQFFSSTALLPALLRLTPLAWQRGFVWQLATYPFIGFGGPSRISPRAERGSTILAPGFTPAEQQSGDPSGGVTSTLKVATRRASAPHAIPAEMSNSVE